LSIKNGSGKRKSPALTIENGAVIPAQTETSSGRTSTTNGNNFSKQALNHVIN
jgi:hypothetical protein